MRLKVNHTTTYRFEAPVAGLVQSLRLKPSEFQGQTIIDWTRDVTDGAIGAGFVDGAGDWVETATVRSDKTDITITNICTVETEDTAGVLRGHRERIRPEVYLTQTAVTKPDEMIRALARKALEETDPKDALSRAHALSVAVRDAMPYRSGETTAKTSAAEALEHGTGVCQDHAHTLIAAARASGIPARYVCGYLFAASDDPETLGAEASHAWAELHVDGLGWVGFDATNAVSPDERYIRLGSGMDAADAAPIRGVVLGGGDETLDVELSVQKMAPNNEQ